MVILIILVSCGSNISPFKSYPGEQKLYSSIKITPSGSKFVGDNYKLTVVGVQPGTTGDAYRETPSAAMANEGEMTASGDNLEKELTVGEHGLHQHKAELQNGSTTETTDLIDEAFYKNELQTDTETSNYIDSIATGSPGPANTIWARQYNMDSSLGGPTVNFDVRIMRGDGNNFLVHCIGKQEDIDTSQHEIEAALIGEPLKIINEGENITNRINYFLNNP